MDLKARSLGKALLERMRRRHGRIVVVTGARQTGKTTLVRRMLPDMAYISLDDPAVRPAFTRLSSADWLERYPRAVVDEVQKAPSIVETLKAAHDALDSTRYVLLGSSQILLLSRVKESLAGRVSILELWPMTLPEALTVGWEDPVRESRLVTWLRGSGRGMTALLGVPAASRAFSQARNAFSRYLHFGGMPVVLDPEMADEERRDWLRDYHRTYLERDVVDLAAMRDIEPFVLARNAVALRTGRAVNFGDLARAASIAPSTARRFMRYLELSYQVVILQPYHRNEEKRLSKAPKVHFVDPGICRSVLGRRGELTGEEFESAVVVEIYKQVRNAGLDARFWWLRTYDGREVDLLLETEGGFVAIEVKFADHVSGVDARHLHGLSDFLDRPLLGCMVLSMDRDARLLSDGIVALPAAWVLGPAG
jgi:predicted AAA+ superfamily ATPase